MTASDVNLTVAAGAYRWIFQHPCDPLIDVDALPQRGVFVAEPVEVVVGDDEYRVRCRTQRRT